MASEHGFTSREAKPSPVVERSKRRFKTERNVQINIKGTADAKARRYRLADEMDATWRVA
jgi:hypothetical protein